MSQLKIGVAHTSKKKNEKRIPIHPDHFLRLPKHIKSQLVFEKGYGEPFNISDEEMCEQISGVASRSELLSKMDAVIIAKPVLEDLEELKQGGILWGYHHCVQQTAFTQLAIERKQTLIAFEDMFIWGPNGEIGRHSFYKNNEMAGYCAVLHALQLKGIDGHYGNQRKVLIFSFGAVSRGAIYALKAHGFRDITICIQRPDHEVREEVLDCHYIRIAKSNNKNERMIAIEHDGSERPLLDLISESDILINGVLQEPNDPINFIIEEEQSYLKKGCLIIDVSCDENMGFYFAKPTTFDNPIFKKGTVDYYGVDHTPSYLWESASRAISAALIVYLPTIIGGRKNWENDETIRKAINIDSGVIQNPTILSFQNRKEDYPHTFI
ncbi:MAG: N(5)-(carboxyethyl)ornithine synthase [Candidatus Puniceispirillales bacterium]|jgi:alanine dehydrogenase|tara:strand:+ start:205 stop:1347 length:1143 start_codon:yes stop_codon:yes gene_type:complete